MRLRLLLPPLVLLLFFGLASGFSSSYRRLSVLSAQDNNPLPPVPNVPLATTPPSDEDGEQQQQQGDNSENVQNDGPPASVIRGRLQLFSDDVDSMYCVKSAISYLSIEPCKYEPTQFFLYDTVAKTLESENLPKRYWTYSQVGAQNSVARVTAIRRGGVSADHVFTTTIPPNKPQWDLPITAFGTAILHKADAFRDKGGTFCMEVSQKGGTYSIFARSLKSANDIDAQCAQLKWVQAPQEDSIPGVIKAGDADSGDCVTYDPSGAPPTSSLYVSACRTDQLNQRFMYNMVTKHVRAAEITGPALFFWWQGPIKQYHNFSDYEDGYGWRLPLSQAGSVTAVDDRGYSGYCWRILQDKRIHADQICHNFIFTPTSQSSLLPYLGASTRQSLSVVLRTPDGRCLVATRKYLPTLRKLISQFQEGAIDSETLAEQSQASGTGVVNSEWWLGLQPCVDDRYHIQQVHVLTQDTDATCTNTACQGHLRWSGDYENILFAVTDDKYLRGSNMAEENIPYTFDFPFDKTDYITRKTELGGVECLGYDEESQRIRLSTEQAKCVKFTMKYAPEQGYGKDDPEVVTLARFDYNAVAYFDKHSDNEESTSDAEKRELALKVSSKVTERYKFFQDYDPFFADLGITGRRRARHSGRGMQVLPSGELVPFANSQSGVAIPLSPAPRLLQYKYIAISVYFSIQKLQVLGDALLLSFARTSGCVLYLTGQTALLGIKCYKQGQEMFTQQVKRWPKKFSLTSGTHKVSLLFSTNASVPFRVFVDGLCVMSSPHPGGWDLEQASNTVRLFTDRNFWQYGVLEASLKRFSLVVSDNGQKMEQVATRLALDGVQIPPLKPDGDLETESGLQTRWENCRKYIAPRPKWGWVPSPTPNNAAVTCDIITLRGNVPVKVPGSVLRLACSRPRCSLRLQSQGTASNFSVIFFPNYPASFNSENVGAPPLFPDPTLLTDGWSQLNMVFDIQYAPNTAKLEMNAATSNREADSLQSESQAQVADMKKYVCVETRINSRAIRPIAIQDDVF